MAATTNGNGNLVDEFEEAFQVLLSFFIIRSVFIKCIEVSSKYILFVLLVSQSCLYVLTKEEVQPTMEKDEIRVELDHTILRFIDLARQMEAFFLQKRFLLSALKPELIVKEVNFFPLL
jgi:mediator of RNA polymerase II transcription subunit 28